jgi:hypothetical protein
MPVPNGVGVRAEIVLIEEPPSNTPRSPVIKGGGMVCLVSVMMNSLSTPLCKGGQGGFFLDRRPWDSAVKPPMGGILKAAPIGPGLCALLFFLLCILDNLLFTRQQAVPEKSRSWKTLHLPQQGPQR